MIRVGQGFDVHAFTAGDSIVLGGVTIPFQHGLKAHSDGDVLVHALCDALLGAVALGDIGQHFPDTDPQYRQISSLKLLAQVMRLLKIHGWQLVNADLTVIAQAPKIRPHADAMIRQLVEVMACQSEQINIKASTTESLGFAGRGEGIACQAVVLVHDG